VVELADTPDLGSGAVRCAGSSPVPGTKRFKSPQYVVPHRPQTLAVVKLLSRVFGLVRLVLGRFKAFGFLRAGLEGFFPPH
jgi:hypothetical protein